MAKLFSPDVVILARLEPWAKEEHASFALYQLNLVFTVLKQEPDFK